MLLKKLLFVDLAQLLDGADVALILSQFGPVLANPGDKDSDTVKEKVQRDYLEKMILRHEQEEGKDLDDD